MTEVVTKKFEDRPDYWEGRYQSTLHTLNTLLKINVSVNADLLSKMSDEQKQKHLNAIAMVATEYEWEQNAK